jgi:hypothetical protein
MTFAKKIKDEISRKWKKHNRLNNALQLQPSEDLKEASIQIKSLRGKNSLASWKFHDLRSKAVRLAAASIGLRRL